MVTVNGDFEVLCMCWQVAEAGACVALNKAKLPGRTGGILTPATGIGMALVERLNDTGLTFTVATSKPASK